MKKENQKIKDAIAEKFVEKVQLLLDLAENQNLEGNKKVKSFIDSVTSKEDLDKRKSVPVVRANLERFFSDFCYKFDSKSGLSNASYYDTANVPMIKTETTETKAKYKSSTEKLLNTVLGESHDISVDSPTNGKHQAISYETLEALIDMSKFFVTHKEYLTEYISAGQGSADSEVVTTLAFHDINSYKSSFYNASDFGVKSKTTKAVYLPTGVVIFITNIRKRNKEMFTKILGTMSKLEIGVGLRKKIVGVLQSDIALARSYESSKDPAINFFNPNINIPQTDREIYISNASKYVQINSVSQPKTDIIVPCYQTDSETLEILYVGALRLSIKKANSGFLEGGNLVKRAEKALSKTTMASINNIINTKLPTASNIKIKHEKNENSEYTIYNLYKGNESELIKVMDLFVGGHVMGVNASYNDEKKAFLDIEANTFFDYREMPNISDPAKAISEILKSSKFISRATRLMPDELQKKEMSLVKASIESARRNLIKLSKHYSFCSSEKKSTSIQIVFNQTTKTKEEKISFWFKPDIDPIVNYKGFIKKIEDSIKIKEITNPDKSLVGKIFPKIEYEKAISSYNFYRIENGSTKKILVLGSRSMSPDKALSTVIAEMMKYEDIQTLYSDCARITSRGREIAVGKSKGCVNSTVVYVLPGEIKKELDKSL